MLIRRVTALPYALLAALLLPGAALADSGGAGMGPAPSSSTSPSSAPAAAPRPANGNATVSDTASGLTITSHVAAVLRHRLTVTGIAPGDAGHTVEVDRRGRETHWQWVATTTATIASDGTFSAVWNTNHIGRFDLRAVLGGASAAAHAAAAAPTVTVTVYRSAMATVYGPGLYGNMTACGFKLKRTTLGVASRTLPCGTPVAILYRGETLIVPVIDRGPFRTGVDWDLTAATARALSIPGTVRLGAVSLPSH